VRPCGHAGVRPACFIHSKLLPASTASVIYEGILATADWFATFAWLAGAALPGQGDPALEIDGINAWPAISAARNTSLAAAGAPSTTTPSRRTEVLIADHILRVGPWKYVAGGDRHSWSVGFNRDCMLGTGGGWLSPPSDRNNNTNLCPLDVYTRAPKKKSSGTAVEIGCPVDAAKYPGMQSVTSQVDLWLCGPPKADGQGTKGACTDTTPCLWNVVDE
jgi:hypothetical protein